MRRAGPGYPAGAAAVVGAAFTLASLSWAVGGTALLDTVGNSLAPEDADLRAIRWHAFLWDPWFLVCGVLVIVALLRSRPRFRDGVGR